MNTPPFVQDLQEVPLSNVRNILDMDFATLSAWLQSLGHKPFRARQLWQWLHQHLCADFSQMHNLSHDFRALLMASATIIAPPVRSIHRSADGCRKFLFGVDDNNAVESVLIPESDRLTLCLSTQVGCAMACAFCATGYQGFNRQLSLAEVVGQLWQVNRYLKTDDADELKGRRVSNIVMMGMGEPLANYLVTVSALKIFLDDFAYGLSRRRVTVSTSGLVGAIDQLAKDCPVSLAISLHAPNDTLRSEIMPVNRRYPLADLLRACRDYLQVAPRSKIMIEYLLLHGINDTDECLHQLADIGAQLPCKINLIPFNRFNEAPKHFVPPPVASYQNFAERLQKLSGRVVIVRRVRGEDVAGACGQLAGEVRDIRMARHKRPLTTKPTLITDLSKNLDVSSIIANNKTVIKIKPKKKIIAIKAMPETSSIPIP